MDAAGGGDDRGACCPRELDRDRPDGARTSVDHYDVAVADGYRFYSYGDSSLLLP